MTLPTHTPRKNPFNIPASLQSAVEAEWATQKKYSTQTMPLTALCFTAIDVTAGAREKIIDVMMAYVETDLLLYRSETPELATREAEAWDPWLTWAGRRYDIALTPTAGIVPVTQSAATLKALRNAVTACDDFRLTGLLSLAQSLSSMLLALAVNDGALEAGQAFKCSRVDEDFQAEKWGEDSLAVGRAREIEREVRGAAKMLELLNIN